MRRIDINLLVLSILFGCCAALASGLAARAYWHDTSEHLQSRTEVISDQVRQARDNEAAFASLVGNSLSERLYIEEICDLPVINAGISRARIEDIHDIARIVRAGGATWRVLSIGVNDISRGTRPEEFSREYARLIGIYEPHVVIGVTGNEREPYNTIIRDLARDAVYVEPLSAEFLQADAMHYTSHGAAQLAGRIEQACAQVKRQVEVGA